MSAPAGPMMAPVNRAQWRAEVWSATFAALYGPLQGDAVGTNAGELPSLDPSGRMTRRQLVARPWELRRLLVPLVAAGLDDVYSRDADFRELVIAAVRDQTPPRAGYDVARERLAEYARTRPEPRPLDWRTLHTVERLLAADELLVVEPSRIVHQDGVPTVSKLARFYAPFAKVREILNPKTWMRLGPFFDHVEAVPGRHVDRDGDGWEGLFEERFVTAWAEFPLQTFRTFLTVDYTFDDMRARTDYALAWEADNQLERDDGFIEVRRVPGRLDWCTYYVEKTMRFRSPLSNLLSPMIMAVFVESSMIALEELAVEERFNARAKQAREESPS